MTERVSNDDLEYLISIYGLTIHRTPNHKHNDAVLRALIELKQRREVDRKTAIEHDKECPYCGEYHDDRVACDPYISRTTKP